MSEYIEREAAVAKITELINQSGKYTDYECGADDACYIVSHMHAADVRPVVPGKWEVDGHHIRCSVCSEYMCNTDREGNRIPRAFCPNCGADMQEVT